MFCEPDRQDAVTAAMQAEGLTRMDFNFESAGAMVIVNNVVGALADSAVGAIA